MRQGLVVLSLILLMVGSSGPRAGAAPTVPSPTTPPGGSERYVVVPAESRAVYRAEEVFFGPNNRFHVAVGTADAGPAPKRLPAGESMHPLPSGRKSA